MLEQTLTPDEFAESIKGRYPQYQDIPNDELTQRILERFPQYRDHVGPAALNERYGAENLESRLGGRSTLNPMVQLEAVGEGAARFLEGFGVDTPQSRAARGEETGGFFDEIVPTITGTASNLGHGISQIVQGVAKYGLGVSKDDEGNWQLEKPEPMEGVSAALQAVALSSGEGIEDFKQGVANGDPYQFYGGLGDMASVVGDFLIGNKGASAIAEHQSDASRTSRATQSAARNRQLAAGHVARSLDPRNLEGRAKLLVDNVADDLARQGVAAWTGSGIDDIIKTRREEFGRRIGAIEDVISEEGRLINARTVLDAFDILEDELRSIDATGISQSAALRELQRLREGINNANVSGNITFDDAMFIRRQWDNAVNNARGYEANNPSMVARVATQRAAAHILRDAIANVAPELAELNKNYALYQQAWDIIRRREISDFGKQDPFMSGIGRISDDLVASYLGHAIGGVPGAVALEGINVLRTRRGFQSQLGRLRTNRANRLEGQLPAAGIGPRP